MVYSATGKVIEEGQLPADCGVIVMNISTVSALSKYFKTGMPLISRRLTVDGDAVSQPKNIEVPLGVSIRDVLEFCLQSRGLQENFNGRTDDGISVPHVDLPIIKNNNAILAFKNSQPSYTKTTACIRCGKCTRVCPVKLMPAALERAYDNRKFRRR